MVGMRRFCCLTILLSLSSATLAAEGLGKPLKWNFQSRARGEMRQNVYDFDSSRSAVTDDSWLLIRLRLGVEWQPVEWLLVALQAQDVRESFSNRPDIPLQNGAEGDDAFDLRLASIEVGNPSRFSVKLGRQVLAYGDERLVGPLEWLNFSRTFDALNLHLQREGWWLDAFTSSVVRYHESEFNRSDWLGISTCCSATRTSSLDPTLPTPARAVMRTLLI